MRKFCVAACATAFVLYSSAAFADTTGLVRGTAVSGGKPAPNTAVTLSGDAATLRATTDAAGTFTFSRVPFGHYTLAIHRDGLPDFTQPVEVQSDSVVNLSIELQLQVIGHAQTAFVKGAGSAPVSVNSVSRAQIAALPDNQSLDSLIETLPGIVRFSYNEPVAHGFHGLTYELDGVPLPQGTTSNFSEVIDPRSIDSLEVFTGAFPAEFGGSRQGAVVNILSHRSNDLDAPEKGSLTIGDGSYGTAQGSLAESVTLGRTRVFLNLNEERTDRGIDSPTFDYLHDNSNQSNQFLRTITNIGARDTLAFDFSNNYAGFQIPINTVDSVDDPVFVPGNTDDTQREFDRFANFVYTNNAKDGNSFTQIAPWYRYDRVAYNGDLASDTAGMIDNGDGTFSNLDGLVQDRRSEFYGVRVNHFHVFGQNAIKAGIDDSVENFHGNEQIAYFDANGAPQNFFDSSAQRGTSFGAYIQDKWTPTTYFSVLGGMRYDHSTGYVGGAQLSPRIEVNGQIDPQDVLHAYFGQLYAAPFIEDTRRAAVIVGGASGTAAYNLQPEHDSYYEFGLAHAFTPQARATVNFWKRDVRNVLDTTQLALTPIEAVFNNTIGIAKGVEGRVDARFGADSMTYSASLSSSRAGGISGSTFLFPPDTDPSDVTLSPEDHDQTFASTFDYTHRFGTKKAWFASVEPEYGTGYPVEFQNGNGRLPPHLTLGASIGREAGTSSPKALGFVVNVQNLANVKYLIKVNNGFNTTQYGEGFRADVRVTAPF